MLVTTPAKTRAISYVNLIKLRIIPPVIGLSFIQITIAISMLLMSKRSARWGKVLWFLWILRLEFPRGSARSCVELIFLWVFFLLFLFYCCITLLYEIVDYIMQFKIIICFKLYTLAGNYRSRDGPPTWFSRFAQSTIRRKLH